jgi:heme-degrading monooxygenase HmoA
MAEVVVLEFAAPDAVGIYNSVNEILSDGSDTWEMPPGLISHVAGEAGDKLIVVEVWESQAHQQAFMESTLGPAFHEANVPEPSRVEWFSHAGDAHRH